MINPRSSQIWELNYQFCSYQEYQQIIFFKSFYFRVGRGEILAYQDIQWEDNNNKHK